MVVFARLARVFFVETKKRRAVLRRFAKFANIRVFTSKCAGGGYFVVFAESPNLMSNILFEILRNALTRS